LSSFAVLLGELPEQAVRRLPLYDRIPAVLLGRLARDLRHSGKGLGELLLMHALEQSLHVSEQIGAHAVVVDALNDRASAFYRRFGFVAFEDAPRLDYLPMAEIRSLFFRCFQRMSCLRFDERLQNRLRVVSFSPPLSAAIGLPAVSASR